MDTATFDLELGRSIRVALRTRGISLNRAAEHSGVPFSTLYRHLHRGGLTAVEMHALAALLDTSVSELTAQAVA